jgi:PAS domain S-box-containing protein
VEAAPNAIVLINQEGKIILVNLQTERLFDYSREELLGQPIEVLVPERFRSKHPGYRTAFFDHPTSRAMGAGRDLYGVRKDGREIPVEIGLNPIVTEEGVQVLASIIDITERKRAEEKFRRVVEAAPSAIALINREGKIVLVNAQSERLFGYSRNELVGQSIEILVPERFRAKHPEHRTAFFLQPSTRLMGVGRDLYGLRKDGREVPVEIGLNPIDTEEGSQVLASIIDITERKQAEEQLRAASQYARLIEASLDPLVTISPEGKITGANEATVHVTGVPREELIGSAFFGYFTEPEKAREAYQEAFAKGFVMDYPLIIRHREGRRTEISCNATVYRNARGEILGVFAAARDVTALKRAEAEVAEQRKKELERLAELERFQKLTIGRELKMIELKKELDELKRKLVSVS